MKTSRTILIVIVFLFLFGAVGQAQNSRYDPSPARGTGKQKSFVDFVFGRINPQNIDYGERIEQWRQGMLDSTVRDYGFWADAFAIMVLGTAFGIIYWQHRQNQNMRFHTARLLCVYHSELAAARTRGDQLQSQYEHFKRAAERQPEEALPVKQPPATRENASAGGLTQLLENSGRQPAVEQQLRQENEKLKGQRIKDNATIDSLRRQVATLGQKLEGEQQKMRKLRGE